MWVTLACPQRFGSSTVGDFARASFQAETRGMAFVLQLHKRRRMVRKQPPPAHAVLPPA